MLADKYSTYFSSVFKFTFNSSWPWPWVFYFFLTLYPLFPTQMKMRLKLTTGKLNLIIFSFKKYIIFHYFFCRRSRKGLFVCLGIQCMYPGHLFLFYIEQRNLQLPLKHMLQIAADVCPACILVCDIHFPHTKKQSQVFYSYACSSSTAACIVQGNIQWVKRRDCAIDFPD